MIKAQKPDLEISCQRVSREGLHVHLPLSRQNVNKEVRDYPTAEFMMSGIDINPLTPRNDQHITSPHNIPGIGFSGRSCYLDLTRNYC